MTDASRKEAVMRWRNESVGVIVLQKGAGKVC